MVSVIRSGPNRRTSGFSIDSLLGNDVNRVRTPSPVSSVSSSVGSENDQNLNDQEDVSSQDYKCHEESVEGCRTCYSNGASESITDNGMFIPGFHGNGTFLSQKHLPYLRHVENGFLTRFPGFPLHGFHTDSNILTQTNPIHGGLPWLHQRNDGGHPLGWSARLGGQFHSRYSGNETPLLLPHFRKPKRIRTAFAPSQLLRLEHAFEKNHYVVGQERKDLAAGLGLSETQVKVWFQNRRTKYKRMKAEEEMTRTLTRKLHERKQSKFSKNFYDNSIVDRGAVSWPKKSRTDTYQEHSDTESDLDV